jgi:cyclopropane fatty-acyl-phospholipid synthase-like methyltransferase
MWNERYAQEGFAYGTDPNGFLQENAHRLAGPVLSLAEGEGRNAVYLASLGLEVVGVDASEVGLNKAQTLAARRGVKLQTQVVDLANYTPPAGIFASVVSIFCHLPKSVRRPLHARLAENLKPGGVILLEAYTPEQTRRSTGGPREPDICPTAEELRGEFPGFDIELLRETEREVVEGRFHTGLASVVQLIARKPN